MGKSKKGRLTITATEVGIETAERALIRLGFETKTNFAKSHYISRSTVTKFFSRKPIQIDTFRKICKELKLNWSTIADIEEATTLQPKTDSNSSLATDGKVNQMEQSSSRQVTVIEPSTGKKVAEITLAGDINSVSNLNIVGKVLREYSGKIIKIQDIQKGITQLTTENSPEDIEKTFIPTKPGESGEFTQINTFTVEGIQVLAYSEEECPDLDKKWRLVQEIVESPTFGRILDGVDLSDADLRDANLRGANLRGADLRGADLISTNLTDANLTNANLTNANLISTNLSNANLTSANLSGTRLTDANLTDANLSGADLTLTHLISANLTDANLTNANLWRADLGGTNVEKARFGYNQGISESMKRDLISRGAIFNDLSGSGNRKVKPNRYINIKNASKVYDIKKS